MLFFNSARYDLDKLGKAIEEAFPGVAAGCTTAGEIGPRGYTSQGIVGVSLGPGPIRIHSYCIPQVKAIDPELLKKFRDDFDRDRMYPDKLNWLHSVLCQLAISSPSAPSENRPDSVGRKQPLRA